MNNIIITAVGLLTCLYASSVGAQTAALQSDLASADWSVKQAKNLNAEPNEVVWKFMTNLPGRVDVGKLCEFQFADLRRSGELSLIVSYDAGGMGDCNDIDVFDKTPAGIEDYDFNTNGAYLDTTGH